MGLVKRSGSITECVTLASAVNHDKIPGISLRNLCAVAGIKKRPGREECTPNTGNLASSPVLSESCYKESTEKAKMGNFDSESCETIQSSVIDIREERSIAGGEAAWSKQTLSVSIGNIAAEAFASDFNHDPQSLESCNASQTTPDNSSRERYKVFVRHGGAALSGVFHL